MAITPEMKEQMDREYAIRQQYIGAAHQKEEEFRHRGDDLRSDTRIIMEFRAGDSPEEMDKYQRAYLSGDPAQREPYLKEFFDDLVNYRMDISLANTEDVEKNIVPIFQAREKFCYSENLLKGNKEFFDDHYSPADQHRIDITADYFATSAHAVAHVLADNGYGNNLAADAAAFRPCSKFQAGLMAETADFLYKQSMSALDQKPFNSTLNLKVLPDAGRGIFAMEKPLKDKKLPPNSPNVLNAEQIFDSVFYSPFSAGCQAKEQEAMHVTMFDMIYIDGVSAKEAFSKKYPENTPNRSRLIKAEVISAMASGKNRLEVATIQRDADNQPKIVVNEVKPDLTAIEPSIKQDYSRIRRAFNFGPFKLKTRTEKINDLLASDKDKEKRQASIAKKLDGGLQTLKVQDAEKEKQKDIIVQEKNVKAHNFMKDVHIETDNDLKYFGKVDYPEGKANNNYDNYFSSNYSDIVKTLSRSASRRSLVDFAMLSKGYTVEDILHNQTDNYKEVLADTGKEVVDYLNNKEMDKLAEIFVKSGEVLTKIPLELTNPNDPEAVVGHYVNDKRMTSLCKDWEQLQTPVLKESIDQLTGSENREKIQSGVILHGIYLNQRMILADHYADPKSCDPELKYAGGLDTTRLMAKMTLDNFRSQQKTGTLNLSEMKKEEIAEQSWNFQACMVGSLNYLTQENQQAIKGGTLPHLSSYLKGTSTNPLHVDKEWNVVNQGRVYSSPNDVKKMAADASEKTKKSNEIMEARRQKIAAEKLKSEQSASKTDQASKTPEAPKKQAEAKTQEKPKKQAEAKTRGR